MNEKSIININSYSFSVDFDMDITPPTTVALQAFTLECNASIVQSNLARGLMQYAHLEWVGPDGEVLTSNGSITITEKKEMLENEEGFRNHLTSMLMFNPVMPHHEGKYSCRSKIDFPNRKTITYNETSTRIQVIGKNMNIKIYCQHKFVIFYCSNFTTIIIYYNNYDRYYNNYIYIVVHTSVMHTLNRNMDDNC